MCVALSEVRWPGHGTVEINGNLILYSGLPTQQSSNRRKGVAVVLSEKAVMAWKAAGAEFDPISERLMRIRLKMHRGYVSVIAVYAPTNEEGNEEETEKFYADMQEALCEVPKRDMVLIMGDFNARVGCDDNTWKGVIGRHGPNEKNENGERLLDFCALNNLVVTNTLFKHRSCHQYTWFHPAEEGVAGHILDYILVNHRFRSSILDTRVFRKTYLQSDHRLVVSTVRLKLKVKRRQTQLRPKHVTKEKLLKKNELLEYQQKLATALKEVEREVNVERLWKELRVAVDSALCSLPLVSNNQEADWVTEEIRQLSLKKQEAWIRWKKNVDNHEARTEYYQLKKLTRKAVEKAQNAWWEDRVEEIEKKYEIAVRNGRGGSLLKDLRILQSNQRSKSNSTLKAANGQDRFVKTGDKLERWREHFENISNIPTEVKEVTLNRIPQICHSGRDEEYMESGNVVHNNTLACVPSEEEIREAIGQLKNNKAPGEDGITAEMLKLGGEPIVEWLTQLSQSIWQSEEIPVDWQKQLIIPLHKRGSYDECDNFRGIALLSVPGKVFCKVIQCRLKEKANQMLRESQCGFRKGRGCADQLFSLRMLMERAREYHTPLFLCFVDLKKAYDSVNRDALWTVLEWRYHLPSKLICILKVLHRETQGAVRAYGKVSDMFSINNGVRQGDVLAPTLFNLFFDAVICMSLEKHPEHGITVLYHPEAELVGNRKQMNCRTLIPDLEYADDMCLVSHSADELEEMLLEMDKSCNEMGLTISAQKTKIMAVTEDQEKKPGQVHLQLVDEPVDIVEEFEYLGSIVTANCELDREVNTRIRKASSNFRSLCRILWYQKKIKMGTKLRMFKAAILPTLLYGSETWAPLSKHLKRLQSFVIRCLRIILGVSVKEKRRHTDIRARANIDTVETMVRKRRLRWLGHVARMDPERIPRQLLVCKFETGRRTVGGQKMRWADAVTKDLKRCKLDKDWRAIAQDRDKWNAMVESRVNDLNAEAEELEKRKKDERKERREKRSMLAQMELKCPEQGCGFYAQNKAGLVNHQRQKHRAVSQETSPCPHCGGQYRKQGLYNHVKFCRQNPAKSKCSGWKE